MTEEMWNALDSIEDCINRLLAIRDVVSLNTLSNEEIVKLIDAMVNMFSDKQKIVWEQYRAEQESAEVKSEEEPSRLAEAYTKLHNEYMELDQKYRNFMLWDTRNQQIEDLTNENTELIRKNEELQKENYNLRSSVWDKMLGDDNFNQQIIELKVQKEFYKDQAERLRGECDRWEERYARMEEDYDNFVNTARTIAQHPSHD